MFRVSYSSLAAWERGDFDRALAPWTGAVIESNEYMDRGKRWHGRWEREVKKTKRAPAVFGGEPLVNQELELQTKRVVDLNDWLQLSGVLDRIDSPEFLKGGKRGIDYKLSKSNAVSWANSKQGNVYKILYPELALFEFHCLNPYLANDDPDRATMSIIHLTDKSLEDGIEWVLTIASEMRAYLENNGISLERPTHG